MLLHPLYHHRASFGQPIASIERSLWRSLCLHSATSATIEPPWQSSCLHSASFAPPVGSLQQLWWFKERTRVVLQQLHRNRTFWLWATTERSGRSKVVRRSPPCVKGALMIYLEMIICIWFWSSTTSTVPYIEHQLYAPGPVACLPCFECAWRSCCFRFNGLCKSKSNSLSTVRHDLYILK